MLNFLSSILVKAYRARARRLELASINSAKAAKVLMDKAVALRHTSNEQHTDSFLAGLTASNLENLLKPVGKTESGKL